LRQALIAGRARCASYRLDQCRRLDARGIDRAANRMGEHAVGDCRPQ